MFVQSAMVVQGKAGRKLGQVFVLTLGNGLNVLMSFVALPFLVRSLSFEDYGSYAQVLLLIAFFQGVFTFSLNQVANIYFSDKALDPRLVFSTLNRLLLKLSLAGTTLFMLTAWIFSWLFKNQFLYDLLLLSSINLFAQVFIPVMMSVLYFHGRYGKTTLVSVLINLFKLLVMYVAIRYFESVSIMMIGLSTVSLVHLIFLYVSVPREIRSFAFFDPSLSKSMMKHGTPLTISSFIERSLFHIDGFMISGLLSTTAFALYRAGALEVPFISGIYGAVAAIILPEIARLNSDRSFNEIIRLKRMSISATAFFVYPVLIYLLFFSSELMGIYLSDRYAQSAMVFAIFNLALFIRVNDFQDVLVLNGKGKFIFQAAAGTAILNIALNYMLISFFGIHGGALAFILSLFSFATLLMWKSLIVLKCSFRELVDFVAICWILVISSFLALLVEFFIDLLSLGAWFVVYLAPVYFLVVFLIGWNFRLLPTPVKEQLRSFLLAPLRSLR